MPDREGEWFPPPGDQPFSEAEHLQQLEGAGLDAEGAGFTSAVEELASRGRVLTTAGESQ